MAEPTLADTFAAARPGDDEVRRVGPYLLGQRLGAGGMGMVFAGYDSASGRKVAVKLLRSVTGGPAEKARFVREAVTLAGLRHTAIVEYIDHGTTDAGHDYLVMEWLVGEDLQMRLKRGPLSILETIALAIRLTDALAMAHAHGVVHRDIKPGNVFLPDGAIGQAKLLDFGIARVDVGHSLTGTGALLGTIGYMAPEQARGDPDLDGRADLYSLGCILHECLTGTPLFTGAHPMAVLAKILLDEVWRVHVIRPDVPEELDVLVADLLARDREARPSDANVLAIRLASLSKGVEADVSPAQTAEPIGVTLREQRIFSLLLLRLGHNAIDPLANTISSSADVADFASIAASFGASYSPLLGGFALISVLLEAPASDVAIQAARCALAIQCTRSEVAQVLVTGRAQREGKSFVGRAIDQAIQIERSSENYSIFVDEATAELLVERFVIDRIDDRLLLVRERETIAVRTLLGRPAPFVGRVREIAWLTGLVREAVDECRSSVVLVTAGPGAGKSRLRVELIRTLTAEGLDPLVLVGRGGPMTRGAALGVLRSALRREIGIADVENADEQKKRLCHRVAASVAKDERARVAAFLGEVCGLHLPDSHHHSLPLARQDASVMADCTQIAWVDWLRAECRSRPILLVLEDLHWGDSASIAYVEAALRRLSELPFVVLALARPEMLNLFPRIWSACRLTMLELPPLSVRAGEMLARQVLGTTLEDSLLLALVARSDGNPFFLEELLRAAATGTTDQLPDTVLGIVQARLQAVDDESRRFLRAASIFGGGFTTGGLARVLGQPVESLRARLAALVQQEFLSSEPRSVPPTYRFRHALLRDASYATLLDEDRRLAHRLAAEWLADQEDYEPIAVAKHYVDASMHSLALEWFQKAAEQALEGGDFEAAVERAEQAIACGAVGEILAELRLIQVEARVWAGSLTDIENWIIEAIGGIRRGSARWYNAIQKSIYCAGVRNDMPAVVERLEWAEKAPVHSVARHGRLLCLCEAMTAVYYIGTPQQMAELSARLNSELGSSDIPRVVKGHVFRAQSTAFGMLGQIDRSAAAASEAAEHFLAAGDLRNASRVGVIEGLCLMKLGAFERAEHVLRTVETIATRLGVEQSVLYCKGILAEVLMRTARADQARKNLLEVLAAAARRDEPRLEGVVRVDLGLIELWEGALTDAEMHVRRSLELVVGQSTIEAYALAALAQICRARGDRSEAAQLAKRALATIAPRHEIHHAGQVWCTLIKCLDGVDAAAYALAVDAGIAWLRTQLCNIGDPELLRSFLALPETRTLSETAHRNGYTIECASFA